jgi:hypothetical protein
VDVAYFAVRFLHEYITKRHEFEGKWVTLGYGFKDIVEAKVRHRVVLAHTAPNTLGAQEFECELRRLIADDPEFGAQLWLVLTQRLDYAIHLTDKEVLHNPELLQQNAAYVPRERDWCIILAAAIGVMLAILGAVMSVRFLS